MIQDGAYNRMIDLYYIEESPLPLDKDELYAAIRCQSKADKEAVEYILRRFFVESPEGFRHARCDEEISAYQTRAEQARENGRLGGRRPNPERTDPVNSGFDSRTHKEPIRQANQKPVASSQEPINKESQNIFVPGGDVPTCPHEEIINLFHSALPANPRVLKWTDTRRKHLQARWRELAVEHGWKDRGEGLEFFSKFFGYVGQSKFLTGKTGNGTKPPFFAELPWLTIPENFAKTVEGKYHGS